MSFLILSNVDVQLNKRELTWMFYTTAKALCTTQRVELINKEKFAKAALNENIKAFIIYINSLSLKLKMTIYSARKV